MKIFCFILSAGWVVISIILVFSDNTAAQQALILGLLFFLVGGTLDA